MHLKRGRARFWPILSVTTAYTLNYLCRDETGWKWPLGNDLWHWHLTVYMPLPSRKLRHQPVLFIASTFCWALASPNPGCWGLGPTPPEILPSVLALTKFARPAGQLLRPPCREEGHTRLSVGRNKQLLWAAGIKVDPARWNLWLFLFLGPAEQQSPWVIIMYSLSGFLQKQWGG